MYLQLVNQHVTKLNLDVNLQENQTLQLENKYAFRITYSDDNSQCKAVLRTDVHSKDEQERLNIVVELEGVFTCEEINDEEAKKQAHVLAYSLLFPYAQCLVSTMATSAGLPPIMIEMARMDAHDVVVQ